MVAIVGIGGTVAAAQETAPSSSAPVDTIAPAHATSDATAPNLEIDPDDPLMTDDVPDEHAVDPADRATAAAVPAPIYPLKKFPVQGKCYFHDTYGAPRGTTRWHEGVDIIAKQGQELYAAIDGTITNRYNDRPGLRSGNALRLTGLNGKDYVFYAHLQGFAKGMVKGAKVRSGQLLGWVGKTGNAGIPHLHFEIHPNGGAPINPTPSVRKIDKCAVASPPIGTTTTKAATTTTRAGTTTTSDWWTTDPNTPTTTKPRSTTTTTRPRTTTKPPAPTTTKAPVQAPGAPATLRLANPARVFDTRGSLPRLVAGQTRRVVIAGRGGVSSSATAVQLNVFVSSPAKTGVLSVFPCGVSGAGSTTTVAYDGGRFVSNSILVGLRGGAVCLRSSAATDVVLDAVGFAVKGTAAMGVRTVKPVRVVDTRATATPLNKGETRKFVVSGTKGVPRAAALSVSVTAIDAVAAGTVTVWACDRGRPAVATLVARAGASTTGNTITRVSAARTLCVRASERMNVFIDVHAAWTTGSGRTVRTIVPARLITTAIAAGKPISVAAAGRRGVSSAARFVVVTVTISGAVRDGTATVWPCGTTRPSTRIVSVRRGGRASGSTVMALGAGGKLCVNSTTAGRVTVDVTGFA